ncbi:MAG: CoA ester lyase [Rhodobiaceae bacterium]|nr:CoA ester lyase [Rhodobiaceae bacterium]
MSDTPRPRRSVLYMPGSNARALEKAKTLAADALILDLEDAVAPDQKEMAREQVRDTVLAGGYGARELIIRINGLATEWGSEDLMAALAARPDAVLVPKVNSPDDVHAVARALSASDIETVAIWAMIETPAAILDIAAIAATADEAGVPLAAFVMGTNDLAKETGARLVPGRAPFLAWLSMALIAARAHGIAVIDGVYNDFRNAEGFEDECRQGRDLGMDGKTLIHPGQIDTANAVFAPAEDEVAWARRIIAAFEEPEHKGKGAITIDGRMVELLHAEMAAKTVAIAEAIAAREG